MNKWLGAIAALTLLGVPDSAIPQGTSDPFAPTAQTIDDFLAQQGSFEDYLAEQEKLFDDYSAQVTAEYEDFVRADSLAFANFQREVEAKWGTFAGSTPKDWVEYSDEKDARTIVDFEKGEARIEVILPAEEVAGNSRVALDALEKAVENLVSDQGTTMDYPVEDQAPQTLSPEPVLANQLATEGEKAVTPRNAEEFSKEVVKSGAVSQVSVRTPDGTRKIKTTVVVKLVPNHLRVRAEKYVDRVRRMSAKYHLDPRLVFAMIHTESYFNPKARSPVPAYGLMQLVPSSGARDAYRHIYGEDKVVTPNFLYDPDKNIEMGCAYLDVLLSRYLKSVSDVDSRHYCAISAYNTGVGNVNRTFTGNTKTKPAISRINQMRSDEVLEKLKAELPHQETRDYIARVLERMKYYEEWGA